LNFSMTLTSYESQVKGVRNLVDLALTSRLPTEIRPQLVFTSSVATVSGWASKKELVPERELDPEFALGTGYGESKWVAEQVLIYAASFNGLKTSILRIGQLSGSRNNGSWNVTDWLPRIVQSGPMLQMLPTFP
ncbi:hypothetical protein K435DRAFT_612509, partial [Dendrothele bispora CBS 962.96]